MDTMLANILINILAKNLTLDNTYVSTIDWQTSTLLLTNKK
jgi:hypothetical protein